MARLTRTGAGLAWAGALVFACDRSDDPRHAEEGTGGTDSAALAASVAAPAGLAVSSVMIGKRVGQGNLITEPTFQFSPKDTVHISVATEGSGDGTLTAFWRSRSGQILQERSQTVERAGENVAFSLSEPKGLKPGTYKVVLFLDRDSVDTKVFVVGK